MTVLLGEATYPVRLSTLDEHEAKLRSEDYNPLSRQGVRGSVIIDRKTWELLGRPVSVQMTLEATEPTPADITTGTLAEVGVAVLDQAESDGRTSEEDDAGGLELVLADMGRGSEFEVPEFPPSRHQLVHDAAVLIRAIQWRDRHPDD